MSAFAAVFPGGLLVPVLAGRLRALGLTVADAAPADAPLPLPGPGEDHRQALRLILRSLREDLVAVAQKSTDRAPTFWIHPGTSLWAERPELLTLAQEEGLGVIAPPSRVLTLFGNKLTLLLKARDLGIETPVLNFDPLQGVGEVRRWAASASARFPFVLKSIRRGAGQGVLVIHDGADLEARLPYWLAQLEASAGETMLLAERYLEGGRLVQVPFGALPGREPRFFPAVDHSLQLRGRKLLEVCPAPRVDPEAKTAMETAARRLAAACDFVGVGTLDFLVEGPRTWLIGGSARLDGSFRLWERVGGVDAVAWQWAALTGEGADELTEAAPAHHHHRRARMAMSARVLAEEPLLGLPQPGFVAEVESLPVRAGETELELRIRPGQTLTRWNDLHLAQIWVEGEDYDDARVRCLRELQGLWIAGSVRTNERYLAELLRHPWVREGVFHASFLEEEFIPQLSPPTAVATGIARLLRSCAPAAPADARWWVGDQRVSLAGTEAEAPPPAWVTPPQRTEVNVRSHAHGPVETATGIAGHLLAAERGAGVRVHCRPLAPRRWMVRWGEWTVPARWTLPPSPPPAAAPASPSPPRLRDLLALTTGRVHSLRFREGAVIPPHEPVVVIESLGILVPHALPVACRIATWKVRSLDAVVVGEDLAQIEVLTQTSGK